MANSFPALCKTTTGTTGTSDYVLGTADNAGPYRTPKQAVTDTSLSDGETVHYMCWDVTLNGDASFEQGLGVYTDATNTISRTANNVIDGSSGPGALVSWPGSGERDILLLGQQTFVGDFGLGTDSPEGKLHVFSGSAGSTTANADYDDLVIENDAHVGISLFAPDDSAFQVNFGTPTNASAALMLLVDGSNRLSVGTNVTGYDFRLVAGAGDTNMTVKGTGSINFTPRSTPSSPAKGDTYMDSTSNKLRTYDGTSWQDHW